MQIFYYFNKNRLEKEKSVVKSIYGGDIKYISEKPWMIADEFKQGDILICNSVDELIDVSDLTKDVDILAKEYMSLYAREIELVFDKSTQCNSLFIKTLINNPEDFETVLKKCILNYANQKNIETKYSRRHVITANKNGNKVGIKKGTKLITKKSIEMKEQIKKLSKDFDGDLGDEDLIKKLHLARNSYYKYKKEIRDGGEK